MNSNVKIKNINTEHTEEAEGLRKSNNLGCWSNTMEIPETEKQ